MTSGSGSGTCDPGGVSQTGYWTKYGYDPLNNWTSATQNAQGTAQTRSFAYDALSRKTSKTNPESGTKTYIYDTIASPGIYNGWTGIPGDLLQIIKQAGDWTCHEHDALHRIIAIGNSNQSTTNFVKVFRYDSSANGFLTPPAGATFANTEGR